MVDNRRMPTHQPHPGNRRANNPHILTREPDGSARLRLRVMADEASLYDEAAAVKGTFTVTIEQPGNMEVVDWLHKTLQAVGAQVTRQRRAQRARIAPPPEEG